MSGDGTVLDPKTVRHLLRESVTVVKPGEVLVLRCPENWSPAQIRALGADIDAWLARNAPDIKVMAVPHVEMAVAEAEPGFMKDVRTDVFRHEHVESVRLTHLPTGVAAVAPSKDEAVAKLARAIPSA